ncbi:LysM peptidoglycan-binding domain-containing protein [uncultured Phycicoccus sp.]|uniref:LysM peptidoglycan-binding domain-containing protein n=1 Tax=uncultured Phycicoccus sp. TaxID=661422 RepID=UPI0026021A29|nr:LysM peptidoglycan-binding domain-containing protein [uncultured Phycicoccus sp.]
MSAIAWEPTEGYAVPLPSRPRLVVLPGGAAAASPAGGLRITARGRFVLLALAVFVLAAVLGVGGVGGAGAASAEHTVTVGSGQTLSEVAATELPGMSVSQGVLAIQLANGLNTAQVSAGQQLVIPRG